MFKNGKELSGVFKGNVVVSAVYQGVVVIWQAIKSCFGKGFWINAAPWVNNDGWKNTP